MVAVKKIQMSQFVNLNLNLNEKSLFFATPRKRKLEMVKDTRLFFSSFLEK